MLTLKFKLTLAEINKAYEAAAILEKIGGYLPFTGKIDFLLSSKDIREAATNGGVLRTYELSLQENGAAVLTET